MSEPKEPKFYEDYLENNSSYETSKTEDYLAEVEQVLLGLEKGLKILNSIGKKPEAKVLENKDRFLVIKKQLLKLL